MVLKVHHHSGTAQQNHLASFSLGSKLCMRLNCFRANLHTRQQPLRQLHQALLAPSWTAVPNPSIFWQLWLEWDMMQNNNSFDYAYRCEINLRMSFRWEDHH